MYAYMHVQRDWFAFSVYSDKTGIKVVHQKCFIASLRKFLLLVKLVVRKLLSLDRLKSKIVYSLSSVMLLCLLSDFFVILCRMITKNNLTFISNYAFADLPLEML